MHQNLPLLTPEPSLPSYPSLLPTRPMRDVTRLTVLARCSLVVALFRAQLFLREFQIPLRHSFRQVSHPLPPSQVQATMTSRSVDSSYWAVARRKCCCHVSTNQKRDQCFCRWDLSSVEMMTSFVVDCSHCCCLTCDDVELGSLPSKNIDKCN